MGSHAIDFFLTLDNSLPSKMYVRDFRFGPEGSLSREQPPMPNNATMCKFRDHSIHLAVFPKPSGRDRIQFPDKNGVTRTYWWIKLGDGRVENSYLAQEPDVYCIDNLRKAPARKHSTHTKHEDPYNSCKRENAKAFELELFEGLSKDDGQCEWYKIWSKSPNHDRWFESEFFRILKDFPWYKEEDLVRDFRAFLGNCNTTSKAQDVGPE